MNITKRLSAAILTVALAFTLVSCRNTDGLSTSSSTKPAPETTAARVDRTKVIRAGYVISAPSFYKNLQTGQFEGHSVEIMNEAAKRLGYRVEWTEEATWGTMIEGLTSQRYDIIGSTSWRNSTRGRVADFTLPIVYSGVGVYVRANDNRFNESLTAINNAAVRIATMDGELAEAIASSDFPNAKQVSLPQMSDVSQLLEEVKAGKADVALMENNTAFRYLKNNPGALKNIAEDRPVRVFGESFIVRPSDERFKAVIDSALEELLNEGYVDRVIAKYEEAPGGKYRVARPYRRASQ